MGSYSCFSLILTLICLLECTNCQVSSLRMCNIDSSPFTLKINEVFLVPSDVNYMEIKVTEENCNIAQTHHFTLDFNEIKQNALANPPVYMNNSLGQMWFQVSINGKNDGVFAQPSLSLRVEAHEPIIQNRIVLFTCSNDSYVVNTSPVGDLAKLCDELNENFYAKNIQDIEDWLKDNHPDTEGITFPDQTLDNNIQVGGGIQDFKPNHSYTFKKHHLLFIPFGLVFGFIFRALCRYCAYFKIANSVVRTAPNNQTHFVEVQRPRPPQSSTDMPPSYSDLEQAPPYSEVEASNKASSDSRIEIPQDSSININNSTTDFSHPSTTIERDLGATETRSTLSRILDSKSLKKQFSFKPMTEEE